MKLDVSKLPYQKEITLHEVINFDKEKFVCHFPLVEVNSCDTVVKVQRFEEFIYVTLNIKANVILKCAYSLEDFVETLKGSDELHFSSFIEDEEDEDVIIYKGNVIELDEYVFNLLSAIVPLSPKKKNAKMLKGNKDFRVISEEELFKEKEEQGNSKFDVLKDLDFD